MQGGIPGSVENGPVSAKANKKVCLRQLLLHIFQLCVAGQLQPVPFLGYKRQAQGSLHPGALQNLPGLQGGPQPPVPVRVGAEENSHSSPPFSCWCEASTRAFRSTSQSGPSPA